MKRALIGGFISLLGTIWGLAIALAASNNLVSGWTTPPGRFLTSVSQMGFVPLPKSANPMRIKQNTEIFDFELSDADMNIISGLSGSCGEAPDPDNILF